MSSNNNLYEFYVNNNLSNKLNYHFKDNKIDTTKYNCITFLPKALLFQFMRPANVYFLICAIIQCIPAISPLDAETALIPIIIVLSVSLIREGIEDVLEQDWIKSKIVSQLKFIEIINGKKRKVEIYLLEKLLKLNKMMHFLLI